MRTTKGTTLTIGRIFALLAIGIFAAAALGGCACSGKGMWEDLQSIITPQSQSQATDDGAQSRVEYRGGCNELLPSRALEHDTGSDRSSEANSAASAAAGRAPAPVQVAAAKEVGYFDFRAYDRDGNLIWQELDRPNGLADEGESIFLDCVLRATNCPTTFYLRLFNDTPGETDTLADLTGEPSTNGYTKQQLTRDATGWPTLALDTGDYQATSATKTFAASGGSWGPVTYCVLATSSDNTGKLVSYVALSQSRTLADGESLQVTYKLKLQ